MTLQSMTNTATTDVAATVDQIGRLSQAGCEIVRVAVPDEAAARAIPRIRDQIDIPLVADIHFKYTLALESIDAGVDALRINPGNIGRASYVREVAAKARDREVPIRIGVNAGSLEKQYTDITAENMVRSAADHIALLEENGFYDIVVSLKSSNVPLTVEAYRLFAERFRYPTHIGITEAGTRLNSAVKTALGAGILLYSGIGDTLRVSITGPPEEELRVGRKILQNLQLRPGGVNIISCPTCARTQVDLEPLVAEVEGFTAKMTKTVTVALMGCAVNGPGEAKHADIGLAGGKKRYTLFQRGEIIGHFPEAEAKEKLFAAIEAF